MDLPVAVAMSDELVKIAGSLLKEIASKGGEMAKAMKRGGTGFGAAAKKLKAGPQFGPKEPLSMMVKRKGYSGPMAQRILAAGP